MKQKPNKEQLYEMYIVQNMSTTVIAKELSIGRTTVCNYMIKHNIQRRSISDALTGMPKSESHKKKISELKTGSKNPNFGKKCKSGKRNWYTCPDGKVVSMRSYWEASFADYLNKNSIDWQYESKTFNLPDGSAYTPDFFLPQTNEWVEVKGWYREEHKQKIRDWKIAFPNEKHILADKKYLTSLGIDLKQKWITSKPMFGCVQCCKLFYRKYPDQKLCCVQCRNKFVSNNGPLSKENKPKRKYNGNQSGQNNSGAKLTLNDIQEIREMKKNGMSAKDIAKQKNSSPSNIYNICRGASWRNIS